jgi:hypothetical protein
MASTEPEDDSGEMSCQAHDIPELGYRIFSDRDKVVTAAPVPGPERLSKGYVRVIAWRKFAGRHVRRVAGALQEVPRNVA